MSYERLITEHVRIDAALAEMAALTDCAQCDLPAVVDALSLLSRELREHLEFEDSFIYPAIAQARHGGAEVARSFVSEFAALREDWMLYLQEWTQECIAADWDAFRAETMSLVARLVVRVQRENDMLYPMALQNGFVRLREDDVAA